MFSIALDGCERLFLWARDDVVPALILVLALWYLVIHFTCKVGIINRHLATRC